MFTCKFILKPQSVVWLLTLRISYCTEINHLKYTHLSFKILPAAAVHCQDREVQAEIPTQTCRYRSTEIQTCACAHLIFRSQILLDTGDY